MRHLCLTGAICACLLAIMAACGSSDSFSVSGNVAGNPNINLYAKYYGNAKVASSVVRVAEGKFQINGVSRIPTLVELTDNEGRPLGYLLAANGDNLSATVNRPNPFLMQVSGSDAMSQWSALSNKNAELLYAGADSAVNSFIEAEVKTNPASIASAMLFATAFRKAADPARADSVAAMLDPAVRIAALFDSYSALQNYYASKPYAEPIDSIPYRIADNAKTRHFSPKGHRHSLLTFCTQYPGVVDFRRDSLNPTLKELSANKNLQIIDFYLAPDTTVWKSAIKRDTVSYIRAWAPGGIYAKGIDRLAISPVPFFIVTDSAGRQLYRGTSLQSAKSLLTTNKKN